MSRGIGWFDAFREIVPEWSVILLGLVTQLGDVWFLGLLVSAVYWTDTSDRDEGAVILGLTLSGLSLITGLKAFFALPRPERVLVESGAVPTLARPLYEATTTATGYGFPSGHALMSTVVYLSLAEYWSVSTARRRYLGAAVMVTIVCLSRVGLGVHYLADVVAGVIAGLAFLLLASALLNRFPSHRGTLGFGLAVVVAIAALVVSDLTPDAVLLFGTSLGAFAGWQLAVIARRLGDGRGPIRSDRALTARAAAAALLIASLAIAAASYGPLSLAGGSGALGIVSAAFVTAPVLYRREHVHRTAGGSPSGSR
ncbi:phosphatase PAP2 family protein [Natrinema sp. 1APR25-10V2]|uniref:phosphatase PAP2 family protein n=1 Tax=Natrinema sp. 1APR25-10V2 TaxID=2951081 RepID=UPI002874EC17|nr:phosphatase PAP2 family protein [Natrinema sp. 1APR25-10V2]MDS0476528.1 phosphatase PAP2 family protein [Natrinema sp. 1APR25-10V2]